SAALVQELVEGITDVGEVGEAGVQLIDQQDGARREVAERSRRTDGLKGMNLLRDACLTDDEGVLVEPGYGPPGIIGDEDVQHNAAGGGVEDIRGMGIGLRRGSQRK